MSLSIIDWDMGVCFARFQMQTWSTWDSLVLELFASFDSGSACVARECSLLSFLGFLSRCGVYESKTEMAVTRCNFEGLGEMPGFQGHRMSLTPLLNHSLMFRMNALAPTSCKSPPAVRPQL